MKNTKQRYAYRYLSYEDAIELLMNGMLVFSSPKNWLKYDPYETFVINSMYRIEGMRYEYPLKGRIFGCCFTTQYSCEAQWKVYGKNENNMPRIQIEFNMERLLESLSWNNMIHPEIPPTKIITTAPAGI